MQRLAPAVLRIQTQQQLHAAAAAAASCCLVLMHAWAPQHLHAAAGCCCLLCSSTHSVPSMSCWVSCCLSGARCTWPGYASFCRGSHRRLYTLYIGNYKQRGNLTAVHDLGTSTSQCLSLPRTSAAIAPQDSTSAQTHTLSHLFCQHPQPTAFGCPTHTLYTWPQHQAPPCSLQLLLLKVRSPLAELGLRQHNRRRTPGLSCDDVVRY